MKYLLYIIAAAAAFITAGCGDGDVTRHPLYTKALQERAAGHYLEAEQMLKNLIAKRPDASTLHMALASLCDEHLGDPLGALYHYREAERLGGSGVDAETLQAWIEAARKRYADTLETGRSEADFQALEKMNGELQLTIIRLRQQLADQTPPPAPAAAPVTASVQSPATAPAASPAPAPAAETTPPAPPKPRIHRIAPGDTLGGLARRYYGSASQFRRIMKANDLTEHTILRIGQEIIIPDRNAETRP